MLRGVTVREHDDLIASRATVERPLPVFFAVPSTYEVNAVSD
jgi:hypothetical protein